MTLFPLAARLLAAASMLMLAAAPSQAQEAPADTAARQAAAMQLIEVTGARKQIELMLDVMKQGIGEGAREAGTGADESQRMQQEFADFSAKFQSYRDQMIEEMAGLYAERFTTAELNEITNFYRSGAGAKFVAAMPELMQRGGAIGQKYGVMALREIEALKKSRGAADPRSGPTEKPAGAR